MIKERILGLFDPEKKSGEPPPLTKEQVDWIKNLARKQVNLFGFTADNAEKMMSALLKSLNVVNKLSQK